MKHLLRTLLFLTFASPAQAAEPPPAMLKDFYGVTNLLRSYGIEPSTLDWTPIETMCMGFMSVDVTMYNNCRLQKGIDQAAFHGDSTGCNDEARAIYPTNSAYPRQTVIMGGKDIITVREGGIYPDDMIAGRRFIYDRCMRDKGWRNSKDWRMGTIDR